jgi:aspartyl-tRNA(Asn)/glutamyl-tRNA(Gln) amidotransferase subunit A
VRDAAILLGSMAGHDPNDTTCVDLAVPDYEAAVGKSVKGLKIGIPQEYRTQGMAPEIASLWEQGARWFQEAGAQIVSVSLPHTKHSLPAYYIVAPAEASSNLARYDGVRYGYRTKGARNLSEMYRKSRDEAFGAEVKRRIMLGTYALSSGYYDAYYLKAQRVRTLLTRDFEQAFQQVDAIVTPTAPTAAFKIGEKSDDPLAMYLADIYTVTADLAGIPGISVPCGNTASGLPIGLQVLGRHFDESTVLRVAAAVFPESRA